MGKYVGNVKWFLPLAAVAMGFLALRAAFAIRRRGAARGTALVATGVSVLGATCAIATAGFAVAVFAFGGASPTLAENGEATFGLFDAWCKFWFWGLTVNGSGVVAGLASLPLLDDLPFFDRRRVAGMEAPASVDRTGAVAECVAYAAGANFVAGLVVFFNAPAA